MSTITVSRTDLGKALEFAALGLCKRPVAPVMAGMLVTVSAAGLELAATDFETTARATVAGQAGGPGAVLVAGAELAAAVKSLPRGKNVTAELAVYDDGLIVLCDGMEATLASLPLDEYPQLPALPEVSGVADAEAFTRSAQRVAVAASHDDTLPVLTCVKVTGEAGSLELAATDRYRLAVDRVSWTGPDGAGALIPAATLVAFARRADKSGKVALHLSEGFAGMSDGTHTLITRTNCGEFPKFGRLIPTADAAQTTVLVSAADLESAVTRAGKMLERNEAIRLDVTADGITVRAMRDGQVASSQAVPAALDGEPLTAGFHPAYLASLLSGIGGEALLSFTTPAKPLLVTSADGTDPFTAVCMPIRLDG
jgi:DNA polymerase-3 subunit beta